MRPIAVLALALLACRGGDRIVDADADGFVGEDDCDDVDPAVHVDATEVCNLVDDDCDGAVDDGDELGTDWHADDDGDGYGGETTVRACTAPRAMIADGSDCDDANAAVFPGAPEACSDLADVDCDGVIEGDDADNDGHAACLDCDDDDPAVNPDAFESCDGTDEDCDEEIDEEPEIAPTWYGDLDGDGAGGQAFTATGCEAPEGYVADDSDCDDLDARVFPDAPERCNGDDDDCDGEVDDDPVDAEVFYDDADGDSHGDPFTATDACEAEGTQVSRGGDCDDDDPTVHPGAPELDCADKVDRNCDGRTGFADGDKDGFAACKDCDDTRKSVNPNGIEVCNKLDDDCDRVVDDNATDAATWRGDVDGDGYGGTKLTVIACQAPAGYVARTGDCNDADATAFPGAKETCDGVDDDCDTKVDNNAIDVTKWYADSDGDGHGTSKSFVSACKAPAGYSASSGDCNDGSKSVYPGAPETDCTDPVDRNCDGKTGFADADSDGYSACVDCDDGRAAVHPGVAEICNGRDDDCDGRVDLDATDAKLWYADADKDTHGNKAVAMAGCVAPAGYVPSAGDCNDGDATAYPGATETCDDVDDDCDTKVDDDPIDPSSWFLDGDGDTYGGARITVACDAPVGYVAVAGDCNDAAAAVHPNGTEACNNADDDCDGKVDESGAVGETRWYRDADADSFGDAKVSVLACAAPTGYLADSKDCADAVARAFPGSHATEVPDDGVDQDCDGRDACVDLTCDGRPDIFAGTHYSHLTGTGYVQQSAILVNVAGAFPSSSTIPIATLGVMSSSAVDLDDDGYLDLVTGSFFDNVTYATNSYVYYGSAAGYSSSDRASLPAVGVLPVHAGDFNQDGYGDVVLGGWYDGDYVGTSYVYWGAATGFTTANRLGWATTGVIDVAVGDLDKDGFAELVVCNYYDGASTRKVINVFKGSSLGYSSRVDLPSIGCLDLAIADFDKDGYNDLLVTNYWNEVDGHNVPAYIYAGSASGVSASAKTPISFGGASYKADVRDLDADGWLDITFARHYDAAAASYAATSWVYYGSSGGFSTGARVGVPTIGAIEPEAGDFNGDGRLDLAFAGYQESATDYTTTSYVYYGRSGGYSTAARTAIPTNGARRVEAIDLNEDGFDDLVVAEYFAGAWSGTWTSRVFWGSVAGLSVTNSAPLAGAGVNALLIPPNPNPADD